MIPCKHCQTYFTPTENQKDFCCLGCQYVYGLIKQEGLEQFYSLQDEKNVPVKNTVFEETSFDWLISLVEQAEEKALNSELMLKIQGVSCVGCVWLIEEVFQRMSGGLKIEVNPQHGCLKIIWEKSKFDIIQFAEKLKSFGYSLGLLNSTPVQESRNLLRKIGLCAAFALNTMLFTFPSYLGMSSVGALSGLFELMAFLFATLSLVFGGSYFIKRSFGCIRQKVLHIDLPISVGILSAYIGSVIAWRTNNNQFFYFDFVSIFILLMLFGRWLQQVALERNRNSLLEAYAYPQQISILEKGTKRKIDLRELRPSDIYVLKTNEVLPVRSVLVNGDVSMGLEWINGESEVTHYKTGDIIPSGAHNLSRSDIKLQALECWDDSMLCALLKKTESNPFRNLLLDRILKAYLGSVLVIAVLLSAYWFIISANINLTLQVLISVLVVSCPCALGIAAPLATEFAIGILRGCNVFVKEESLFSKIGKIRKIVFDKTGTLTLETLSLKSESEIDSLPNEQKAVLLTLVSSSYHPVSRCLKAYLMAQNSTQEFYKKQVLNVEEVIGQGLWSQDGDRVWTLGRPTWGGLLCGDTSSVELSDNLYDAEFCLNGKRLAHFSFDEAIRLNAKEEIQTLSRKGFDVFILSGDRSYKVRKIASLLGLDKATTFAEMTPREKADWMASVNFNDTLMIGDGANDSMAFDQAFCAGTPVIDRGFLEKKSDFYFLGTGLEGICSVIDVSRSRKRALWSVFVFSTTYNIVAIIVCALGRMSPLLAAIIMPLSSLVSVGIVFVGFLNIRRKLKKSGRRDSNSRPLAPHASALPDCATARKS